MEKKLEVLRENYPGYTFELNEDNHIIMEKKFCGGTRPIGVFESTDELVAYVHAIPGC